MSMRFILRTVCVGVALWLMSGCGGNQPPTVQTGQSPIEPQVIPETCLSDADCHGLICARWWNACGVDCLPPDCPEGWVVDDCGHCFQICSESSACPDEQVCFNGMCGRPPECVDPSWLVVP